MIKEKTVEYPQASPGSNGHPHDLDPPATTKALPAAPERKELPAPEPPRRKRRFGLLWLAALGVVGYIIFHSLQVAQQKKTAAEAQQAERAAHRAVPVAATAARLGDMPIVLRGLGTVTAFNTVNVKSRVDGPLIAVNYQEGQFINKGDALAQIDPRTFQVTVDQAEGQMARDQAQLKDAQTNLARYQALWQAGVIAKQQLDTQASQVGQFEGAIKVDQANIDNAKLQLSFTKVTAPLSGRMGLRLVDVGNMVHAGDANPIAIITQMQPIAVLFTIPADNLPPVLAKLRAGAKLPVDAYDRADANKIASGTLETVDNTIDSNTGTSRLKAIFPNDNSVLFPNQFVNCRLLLDTKRGVILIPAPAVQRGPQGPYVYVAQSDGTAVMRSITEGTTEGSTVEIVKGLNPGEMVITDGQDKLQPGGKVQLREGGGQSSGAAAGGQPASGRTGGGRRQQGKPSGATQ